jgi:hypothetical protein
MTRLVDRVPVERLAAVYYKHAAARVVTKDTFHTSMFDAISETFHRLLKEEEGASVPEVLRSYYNEHNELLMDEVAVVALSHTIAGLLLVRKCLQLKLEEASNKGASSPEAAFRSV